MKNRFRVILSLSLGVAVTLLASLAMASLATSPEPAAEVKAPNAEAATSAAGQAAPTEGAPSSEMAIEQSRKQAEEAAIMGKPMPEGGVVWGEYEGTVSKVIDADTLIINDIRFKLLGVNAPDRTRSGKTDECYSDRSAKYLEEQVLGQVVTYSYDRWQGKRDRRGVKHVYLFFDGRLINAELIEKGFAFAQRDQIYGGREHFRALEKQAYLRNIGLWHSCPVECDRSDECWTRDW